MKKVININFQGRVVPIEESAYEMLQNYISSLRAYFAKEEGRDEIINDIESRIGELFNETLKKGVACITDADVDKVIASMGRPEDFEKEDSDEPSQQSFTQSSTTSGSGSYSQGTHANTGAAPRETKRLYRNEQDKILAGVASGVANYLNIDPAIIRILFTVLALFGGSGFLIYIILWIVLPSRSLVTNIRKRLFRDTDDRVIAGVAGGLAKYFDINPAIPRVIFAAPFILGIITSVFRSFFHGDIPFIGGFGGGTFILVYIILWIVLPEAHTAAEKLEMRGEKVDLNSIRETVVNDLQGFKGRAQKAGKEFSASAQKAGSEMKEAFASTASNVASDVQQSTRRRGGIGNAIAILVKAFIYFIGGCIAFGLFVALIVLLGTGAGVLPIYDFFLQGTTQYMLALGSLILFIGVPIIAVLVWFIRRLMKVRTPSKYLGMGFTALWFAGLFCLIGFLASINRSFSSQVGIRQDVALAQPTNGKLIVKVEEPNYSYSDGWFDMEGVMSIDEDTLFVNTVKVNVVKSKDSLYHIQLVKLSRGRDRNQATDLAEKIDFTPVQKDSVLYLPETFKISRNDKWRNQKVLVIIEVPLGKEIYLEDEVNDYDFFNIEMGRRRNYGVDWDNEYWNGSNWPERKTLKMTENGLDWDKRRRNDKNDWNNTDPAPVEPAQPDAPATPKKDTLQKIKEPTRKDSVYRYKEAVKPTENNESASTSDAAATSSSGSSTRLSNPLASVLKIF